MIQWAWPHGAAGPLIWRHALQDDAEQEVDGYLRRKYTTAIRDIETVSREDLDLKNHLSGLQRKLLKVRTPL